MPRKWWPSRSGQVTSRRATDDLVRSLALILEPDALRASIARRIGDLVGGDSVTFCTLRVDEDCFVGARGSAAPDSPVPRFAAAGTLAKWIRLNDDVFLIPHPSGALDHLDACERTQLQQMHARACVPIQAGSQLIGILIIGASDPQWRLSPGDVDVLLQLGRQAGLALQNAELQLLERERLKNVYRAEQLAVAGQLAATVAHEIRNPLTAIRSSVQYTLTSTADWPTKQRLLEGVLEAVDRIDHTIGGALALTRSDAVDLSDVDLVKTVDEALMLTEAYARAHDIVVERQFEVIALPVVADRRGLQQVCINLFLNACQAMPGGGRATLRCAVTEPAVVPPSAVLQIRDTGLGIAAEDLPHVFDPFFTTKPGGTGLGLPICLDIITRHRGQLRLDSEPGRGTTATILLPLRTS